MVCPNCGLHAMHWLGTTLWDSEQDPYLMVDLYGCDHCGEIMRGAPFVDEPYDFPKLVDLTNTDSIEPLEKPTHSPDGAGDYKDELPF